MGSSQPQYLGAIQVGGHGNITTTEDGSLIIKPFLPFELAFYQSLLTEPALEALHEFTPKFLGTLKLQGQAKQGASNEEITLLPLEQHVEAKESLVLENITHPFVKPYILDIKLGTVLYAPDASPEKKERMEKTARNSTSLETGVRLTGFQVWNNATSQPVTIPKSYGKSIAVADLPTGIAGFFPTAEDINAVDSLFPPSSGLPVPTLLPILHALRDEIGEIRRVLGELELRIVGGSLLIVYEGDERRAAEGIKRHFHDPEDVIMEQDDDSSEDGSADDDSDDSVKIGLPCDVKLIDFAHARLVPGEGPDESVLRGVDTVLNLLDKRILAIKAVAAVSTML